MTERTPTPAGQPRTALITGGARGIGRACADRLTAAGWTVVIGDVSHPDPTPSDRFPIALDVLDPESVDGAVAAAVHHGGSLDLLVNCAGIQVAASITDMSDDDWLRVLDVNLHGTWRCMRAAGRVMVSARSGAVVNIASIAAARGVQGRSAYAASKAAVVSLTQSAAVEWAPHGVRVNAVAPGFVDTELTQTAIANGMVDEASLRESSPMRRLGTAGEIADAVAFLGSGTASFVTGQTLFVDGGFTADYKVGLADRTS